MRAHPQRTRSAEAGVSAEFGESVSHRGQKTAAIELMEQLAWEPRTTSLFPRQSGKQFGDRQGAA